MGNKAAMTSTWYPYQSGYHDTEPISPCPILLILSTWLGSDKYQFLSHWFDFTRVRTHKVQIPISPKNGRRMLHSFGHPVWFFNDKKYFLYILWKDTWAIGTTLVCMQRYHLKDRYYLYYGFTIFYPKFWKPTSSKNWNDCLVSLSQFMFKVLLNVLSSLKKKMYSGDLRITITL